jgi:hypothetical protein
MRSDWHLLIDFYFTTKPLFEIRNNKITQNHNVILNYENINHRRRKELGNDAKYLAGEDYICEFATTYSQAIEK